MQKILLCFFFSLCYNIYRKMWDYSLLRGLKITVKEKIRIKGILVKKRLVTSLVSCSNKKWDACHKGIENGLNFFFWIYDKEVRINKKPVFICGAARMDTKIMVAWLKKPIQERMMTQFWVLDDTLLRVNSCGRISSRI